MSGEPRGLESTCIKLSRRLAIAINQNIVFQRLAASSTALSRSFSGVLDHLPLYLLSFFPSQFLKGELGKTVASDFINSGGNYSRSLAMES